MWFFVGITGDTVHDSHNQDIELNRLLPFSFVATLLATASMPVLAQTQPHTLSKLVLMQLSRDQSQVLCQSEVFTQCMGFARSECLDLSEKALEKCLAPLPDTINLSELQNDTLEACPQTVYTEAGYTEERALTCLQQALK